MQYRDLEFQYEAGNDELGAEPARQRSAGKQYRRTRFAKSTRRQVPKGSRPDRGICGRRKRRWTW